MSDEHHRRASKGRGIDATPAEDTKSNNPPLYWSVLHHKNLHEGAQSAEKNTGSPAKQMGVPHTEEHDVDVLKSHERLPDEDIPLVIHDRQPLISEVSSRSALSGYGSTTPPISSPFTSQRPIDDHHARKESKWASVRKMVHEKELMIRHIPPAEKNGTAGKRLWSDLSGFSYELTLRECLYLFLALLAVGAVAYSFIFEQWTVIDSLYFTCVMLTTVGYGDETPSTAAGKLFASIFSLGGIVLLGLALGVFGSQLVEAEIKYTQNISSLTSKALEGTFLQRTRHRRTEKETPIRADLEATDGSLSRSCSESSLESVQSIGSTQSSVYDPEASLSRSISSKSARHLKEEEKKCPGLLVIRRHLPGFAPLIIGGLAIAYLESWRWYDTIYYCIVTATVSKTRSHVIFMLIKRRQLTYLRADGWFWRFGSKGPMHEGPCNSLHSYRRCLVRAHPWQPGIIHRRAAESRIHETIVVDGADT